MGGMFSLNVRDSPPTLALLRFKCSLVPRTQGRECYGSLEALHEQAVEYRSLTPAPHQTQSNAQNRSDKPTSPSAWYIAGPLIEMTQPLLPQNSPPLFWSKVA
jgi:hypothetical protein